MQAWVKYASKFTKALYYPFLTLRDNSYAFDDGDNY
jgi:hypothetical protein